MKFKNAVKVVSIFARGIKDDALDAVKKTALNTTVAIFSKYQHYKGRYEPKQCACKENNGNCKG